MPADLPVRALEEPLHAALRRRARVVLTAPTGSGKTTQVPQMLLAGGAGDGQIIVLQPRRLAVRMVARRVACEMDTPVGGLVGYQTRYERVIGKATRIRFVTDGLFLRLCQSDPHLRGIDAVVIDEFHERSLAADVALGWIRRLQEQHRPELRLVIMSATLDAGRVSAALECPALEAPSRRFPVDISYRPPAHREPVWDQAARALMDLLQHGLQGHVLVFMPGQYEISRTLGACRAATSGWAESLSFMPLHGGLPGAEQDAAVAPAGQPKVIVSTNVAETSITIPGVAHVIDSGLARVHRHDPRRGIDVLLTEPISTAAAEQRAGRAGRTGPGTCVRLWSAHAQGRRPAQTVPEVLRVDLADAVLLLAALGESEPDAFPWLDPPAPGALAQARRLLMELGALDDAGGVTPVGRRLARLPVHPRLGRMLVEAEQRQCLDRAMLWAALLGERDIVLARARSRFARIPDDPYPSDLEVRERAFLRARQTAFDPAECQRLGLRGEICRQVERAWGQLRMLRELGGGTWAKARKARTAPGAGDRGNGDSAAAQLRRRNVQQRAVQRSQSPNGRGQAEGARAVESTPDLLRCVLVAFFDRVALRRDGSGLLCAMARQRRVELDARSITRESSALVALEARELGAGRQGVRTVLSLASAIDIHWLQILHPQRVTTRATVSWNAADGAVEQYDEWTYDGLVYRRRRATHIAPAPAEALLVERIQAGEIRLDRWDDEVAQWILRTRLVARLFPDRDLLTYTEDELAVVLHEIVAGATRASHLRDLGCLDYVRQALTYPQQQFVDQMAPARLSLPGGTRMRIRYQENGPPRGRARIQELYGLRRTPAVAGGRQPLLLEILGPNMRPVQITEDLESFWRSTYPELKKELRRRYPKHEWR